MVSAVGSRVYVGWRITVYDVLEYLASGMSEEEILSDFPDLELAEHSGLACRSPQIASGDWYRCQPNETIAPIRTFPPSLKSALDDIYPDTLHVKDVGLEAADDVEVWS